MDNIKNAGFRNSSRFCLGCAYTADMMHRPSNIFHAFAVKAWLSSSLWVDSIHPRRLCRTPSQPDPMRKRCRLPQIRGRFTPSCPVPTAEHQHSVSGQPDQLVYDGIWPRLPLPLWPSAAYVITKPTQPEDQLDFNKLPGFSDCGTLDLSVNGAMFSWRWRLDRRRMCSKCTPTQTTRANTCGRRDRFLRWMPTTSRSDTPLRYRVWIDGAQYRFAVSGTMRGRAVSATTTLPRVHRHKSQRHQVGIRSVFRWNIDCAKQNHRLRVRNSLCALTVEAETLRQTECAPI